MLASIEPFGSLRDDVNFAMLAATVTNMSGKSIKKNVDIKDFMIDYMKPPVVQSVEEMHANFLRILEFAKNKAAKKPS